MARKSKGFHELIKQEQSSQGKQKNLEALREKMQEGVFGELAANMVIEPKGAIKMSDVLKQFVDPYLHTVHNLKQCKALLSLGVVAWNASLLSESEQKSTVDEFLKALIDEFLEESLATDDVQTKQDTREIITELITRKNQHFSNIKRMIMDFDVTKSGQRYDISVASTLLETK
jgi:hypothetical protein